MPLGKSSSANVEELSSRCKHEGGFGNIQGKSRKECQRIAVAAGMSAARERCAKECARIKADHHDGHTLCHEADAAGIRRLEYEPKG